MAQNMDPAVQNSLARSNLLTTGIPMVKRLAPINALQNSETKIPLLRMGIMTGVLLQFTVTFTVGAGTTETATLSPVGPWNAIRNISYTDFAGTKRTNTSGVQLWLAQNFKNGDAAGAVSRSPRILGAPSTNSTYDLFNATNNILNATGSINAGGVTSQGGTTTLTFSLYVPMAYSADDLTGAVLTQTNVGEHYITVNIGNLLGADVWYNMLQPANGATLSDTSITVEAFQHYIQPQSMSITDLPLLDLSTVYGFEGAYETTANIQNNMPVYVNYPNNRTILSALVNFQDNNAFNANGSDLNGIVLMANSNTNFREMSPRYVKELMRNMANFDAPGGAYFFSHRRNPILTQLYANVQLEFQMGTLGGSGTTKLISQYEVQYPSGSPLPGVTVAA